MERQTSRGSTMNQTDHILALLKQAPLTALGALKLADSWRLGARIYDLRAAGHHIRTDMIRTGTGKRVARYTLVKLAKGRK